MPTPKKKIAKKAVVQKKREPAVERSNHLEFGSEGHAVRTILWAVDLGLVPRSVHADAVRAEHASELASCLEHVRLACLARDYAEQAKRIGEMQQRIRRAG